MMTMPSTGSLLILAGKSAFDHIRENGLEPDDIRAVLGASGAAKWLAIYGLDKLIFSGWFKGRQRPLHLFGTSIGAWKFAAAAQEKSSHAFDSLKDAYIHQVYDDRITPSKISRETKRIITLFLPDNRIEQILSHPVLRIAFSAVRCKSILASRLKLFQAAGMWSAFELNLLSRKLQRYYYERALFHDPRYDLDLMALDDFPTFTIPLDRDNFLKSLLASASIPMIMEGVSGIKGAPRGTYRDGGLLDYHPAFPLADTQNGFILYPHFYPELTLGWFDKKFPPRRADTAILDRMILLSPSPEFIRRLPNRRIPDRHDFIRLKGRDRERIRDWTCAAQMSLVLGEEFLAAVETGGIAERVRLIG